MLHKFDVPLEWKQIGSLLESIDIRNEIEIISFNPNKLKPSHHINELLEALEAKQKTLPFNISFKLIYLYQQGKYIMYEPHFHFNKYRLISLRADFYEKNSALFDVLKHKNYCRTKQEEAIKSGLRKDVWQNEIGDNLFGQSEEAGYFGGNGSSGWKYLALCNFLLDFYAAKKKISLYRITPYENIMIEGKLLNINKLLHSSDEEHQKALQKYFTRIISLPLQ